MTNHLGGPSIDKLESALGAGLQSYQDVLSPHHLKFYMSEGARLGVARDGRFANNQLITATAPLLGEFGRVATLEAVVLRPGEGTGLYAPTSLAGTTTLQAGLESMASIPVDRPGILGEAVLSLAAIRGEEDPVLHAMRIMKIGMRGEEVAVVAELGQAGDTYSRIMDRVIRPEPSVTFTIKEFGKDASSETNPGLGLPEAFVNLTSDTTVLLGFLSIPESTGTWHQRAFNILGAGMPIQLAASAE